MACWTPPCLSTLLLVVLAFLLLPPSSPPSFCPPPQLRVSSRTPALSLDARLLANAELLHALPFDPGIGYKTASFTILGHTLAIIDLASSMTAPAVAQELEADQYSLLRIRAHSFVPASGPCSLLDLGTNVGITAILLAKLFPACRVIGIEPAPPLFAAALRNLAANGVSERVTVLPAALVADDAVGKQATIRLSLKNPGSSTLSPEFYGAGSDDEAGHRDYSVWGLSVDELLDRFSITSTPFIKLDCEGCEFDVIPSLSPRSRRVFENAILVGETHDDRMAVSPYIVDDVHALYDTFYQSGAAARYPKLWDGKPPVFL